MINRRLIRVKVFKTLFAKISSSVLSLDGAKNDLLTSCDKSLELYYFVLSLPIALKQFSIQRLEILKDKFFPVAGEEEPYEAIVNNSVISMLESDKEMSKYYDSVSAIWNEHSSVIKKIFTSMAEEEYFLKYYSGNATFKEDLEFLITFFEAELEDNDEFHDLLEDISLFWIDDLEYVVNVVIKNLGSLKPKSVIKYPAIFIKDEDREYAVKLLEHSLLNYESYSNLITSYLFNWDLERLALSDTILIIMGIAEAVEFADIPIKVTINEYVELSKFYSTPNSKTFVNGILDKVVADLVKENKIVKSGRGLIGSID